MKKIVVVGAGVMGTAIAIHLANNQRPVRIWGTKWDKKAIDQMKETGERKELDVKVPSSIEFFYQHQLEEAVNGSDVVILAVTSEGIEAVTKELGPYLNDRHIILNVTKGIDEHSLRTISTVIEQSLPEELRAKIPVVKIGGPIIAKELAHSMYTEAVFASKDDRATKVAKKAFDSPTFKGNISSDIDGVDLCAAFKNSYAIGMGIMSGVEVDTNNSKAALMARGTVEMSVIVEAYGGCLRTASGIAGIGDYYVTSQGGRNGIFGKHIGEGATHEEAFERMGTRTIEGLAATRNGYRLLEELEHDGRIEIAKDVPFFNEIYQILCEGKDAKEAVGNYWSQ